VLLLLLLRNQALPAPKSLHSQRLKGSFCVHQSYATKCTPVVPPLLQVAQAAVAQALSNRQTLRISKLTLLLSPKPQP
jgi:hypothetical protein